MKKFLPYILIVIIFAQLFVPFTIGSGVKNNIEVKTTKAEAADSTTVFYYTYSEYLFYVTDNKGNVADQTTTTFASQDACNTARTIRINVEKANGTSNNVGGCIQSNNQANSSSKIQNFVSFSLSADCEAERSAKEAQKITVSSSCTKSTVDALNALNTANKEVNNDTAVYLFYVTDNKGSLVDQTTTTFASQDACNTARTLREKAERAGGTSNNVASCIKSSVAQVTQKDAGTAAANANNNDGLPVCVEGFINVHVGGCIAQGIYWLFFRTTSFIFGLTGKFLDFTLMYSINDTSYRSTFVTEGWGIVRDFCNMFFIFVMLYIAFGTILKLHSVKTKEMIINVVIIGLLINFSLFATQVIIDASNILTRVFYNQNTIITGTQKDANGKVISELGEFGEIKLSEAIVNKVDPQQLILRAQDVGDIPVKGSLSGVKDDTTKNGVTTGTFIIVVLLATAVNVVGLLAFLSAAIIFVTRVIGLWLAMILAPIAFFSYTVPGLKNMPMVGWEKWWPETIKLAFLAPVFTFFMYLIVGFMDKGLGIMEAAPKSGLGFVVAIAVPFVFIMVLLSKASDIAKDMSGEMGQKITNGIKAAGGIALGGAALGTALVGRKIIGTGLAAASRSPDAMHRATEKIAFNKNLEKWETNKKNGVAQGDKPTWKQHAEENNVKGGLGTIIGAKLNEKQMKIGDVDFARSQMDETKKAAGLVDASGNLVDDANLSGVNEKKMKDTFARTKRPETEAQVRKGVNAKGDDIKIDGHKGEEAYKSANRNAVRDQIMGAPGSPERTKAKADKTVDENDNLTRLGEEKLRNELNIKLNAAVKLETDNQLAGNFNKLRTESKQKVGGVERAFSRTNSGSWDVRKISDAKVDSREGFLTKIPVALIGAVAMGVRGGLKSSGMSNGGVKVEGNFMKDLGNTISDSLKSMKVNVDLGHVGETKSSADAHGGGAHH